VRFISPAKGQGAVGDLFVEALYLGAPREGDTSRNSTNAKCDLMLLPRQDVIFYTK
jgi:hypothetical protein